MDDRPAERRILESLGEPDLVERLAALRGTDFTSFLLAVFRKRASKVGPPDVLHRYRDGRFATPSLIRLSELRTIEDKFLAALPDGWETLILSPLVPFGTHHAMGDVAQDRVLSSVRGTEVAADPTNALALEAALRRSGPDDPGIVRLAAIQRVIRGQRFDDARSFAQSSLFALGRQEEVSRAMSSKRARSPSTSVSTWKGCGLSASTGSASC